MPESSQEARYRANLQGEVDGAYLYRTLAEVEPNPQIAEIYGRLAAVEDGHAQLWRKQIEALGKWVTEPRVSWRTGALAFLARRFGPGFVLPVINTLEQVDSGAYSQQPEAVTAGLPQAERSHARILQTRPMRRRPRRHMGQTATPNAVPQAMWKLARSQITKLE